VCRRSQGDYWIRGTVIGLCPEIVSFTYTRSRDSLLQTPSLLRSTVTRASYPSLMIIVLRLRSEPKGRLGPDGFARDRHVRSEPPHSTGEVISGFLPGPAATGDDPDLREPHLLQHDRREDRLPSSPACENDLLAAILQ